MTRRIGILFLAATAFGFGFPSGPVRAAEDAAGGKREATDAKDAKDAKADGKTGGKTDTKAGEKPGARSSDQADEKAAAVLDKAVEAVGGREKLREVKAATWQSKGKITLDGGDNDFTSKVAVCGLHQYRQEFAGTFGGDEVKGVTVVDGDQGWRRFNGDTSELDKDGVANERRSLYLQVAAVDPLVLKSELFKVESAGEEKVGDKPATVLKVTGPDGKDFTESFDKETGLPVRQVAKVTGWDGGEFTQDVTFSHFKDFDGVKKAAHVEMKRDGNKFITYDLTEFKPLTDNLPAERFAEPK